MRSRLAALVLMGVLVLMGAINLPAAPVPDPSAVLDIGPPPKGAKAEEYCKQVIRSLTYPNSYLWNVGFIDEGKKLPSIARLKEKEVGPWLVKNIQIKEEDGGRRLRFTFRAGTRAEQAAILNAMLRCYMGDVRQSLKDDEEALRPLEKQEAQYANARKEERDPKKIAELKQMETNMKTAAAPIREGVARGKQIKVIKWAK